MPSVPVTKPVLPDPPDVPPDPHADSTSAETAAPLVNRAARLRVRLDERVRFERWGSWLAALM
ncbi:hypothetical protein GCM10010307_42020 [Streptomyces vastus]|uniref:ABC transporter permease n=1 Tax=Streptomyces vastus TaxID=285451 RepID=A0ABN3R1I6_9ACTN